MIEIELPQKASPSADIFGVHPDMGGDFAHLKKLNQRIWVLAPKPGSRGMTTNRPPNFH
ncbi:MAG: hypothetical protein ACK4N1_09705 [Pseudorhizobium sp.]